MRLEAFDDNSALLTRRTRQLSHSCNEAHSLGHDYIIQMLLEEVVFKEGLFSDLSASLQIIQKAILECMLAHFAGLVYLQLGTSSTSAIFDRQSSLFLQLVMLAFTPANTACTVWDTERLLLR